MFILLFINRYSNILGYYLSILLVINNHIVIIIFGSFIDNLLIFNRILLMIFFSVSLLNLIISMRLCVWNMMLLCMILNIITYFVLYLIINWIICLLFIIWNLNDILISYSIWLKYQLITCFSLLFFPSKIMHFLNSLCTLILYLCILYLCILFLICTRSDILCLHNFLFWFNL